MRAAHVMKESEHKWSPKRRLEMALEDMRKEVEIMNNLEKSNCKKIRALQITQNISNFICSAGYSGAMGVALASESVLSAVPVVLPTTMVIVILTLIASGISITSRKVLKYFQKQTPWIEELVILTRETEKGIYQKYLKDGVISPEELIEILADIEQYHIKAKKIKQQ